MNGLKRGFDPFCDGNSRLLVLGSFPSVRSRKVEFYYGNRQNRFWRTVCSFFGEGVPDSVEEKKDFLTRRNIALWDIVTECEIVGSQDATIKNYKVADVRKLLDFAPIELIIVNGGTALKLFEKYNPDIETPYIGLPSTSPANTKFSEEKWQNALRRVFG